MENRDNGWDNLDVLQFANALIYDGSGADPIQGSVLVKDGRIEAIESNPVDGDYQVVDCEGLVLAPGFIDVHSHSDIRLLQQDQAKTRQGVTAEVVGNCGFSAFPCGHHPDEVRTYGNAVFCGGEERWQWQGARPYLAEAEARSTYCHIESLVGHGTLRTEVCNARQGSMDPREFDTALGLLRESLEQGAIGLSTGLMYAPGSSAPREELLAMCALVAKLGKIYTTHMRSYSDDLLPSIEEQLNLARETGCRLQISHLQAVGQRNWKKQQRALELLEEARMEGVDVEFDSYPYLAGSTVLTQLLPQWALDGGTAALVDRLGNAALREQILKEIATSMPQGWNNIVVAGVASEARQHLVGNTIAELAEVAGVDASEFALDLIVAESAQVSIVSFNQSEENLRKLLTHPLCTVISDGFYVRGRPHPRLFGTFPALLGEVSRDQKWMPLAEAIYRITAKPADRFGLKHRGRIAKGYLADLVLFDACSVASRATYEAPQQSPVGIKAIYRAGKEIPIRE